MPCRGVSSQRSFIENVHTMEIPMLSLKLPGISEAPSRELAW
jgi:hypothetical protein